jgi:hypothetical protein
MRAWMRDQKGNFKRLAPIQLVDKSVNRFFTQLLVRRSEVYQVRVMRDDYLDSIIDASPFEAFYFFGRVRLRGPLPGRAGENLDTFAADLISPPRRLAYASGD